MNEHTPVPAITKPEKTPTPSVAACEVMTGFTPRAEYQQAPTHPPTETVTAEEAFGPVLVSSALDPDPNVATAADLFALLPPILTDGVHDLVIARVSGGGQKTVRLHVEAEDGGKDEIMIGVPGSARLRKHLRLLLGTHDVDDVEAALTGRRARLKVTTFDTPGGKTMRGIERVSLLRGSAT